MTVLHRQLALADLRPDMVLSDDLLDPQGQILLPKGTVLTQHAIDAMHRHQVVSVPIVIGELSPEEVAARKQHAEARLARLFRLSGDTVADELLRRYVSNFRLGEEA
ncbi:MAG TPA: hypothetical protein VL528_03330 [Oxalicibacterium sp.]|nr:hypothetical protein [Oxalicibacterium sp.]